MTRPSLGRPAAGVTFALPPPPPPPALDDGVVLYQAGEARDAAALLNAVANDTNEATGHRARAFLYLALCQLTLGDAQDAALSFRQAFQLDATVSLPEAKPPGALALANETREQLGLPALAGPAQPGSSQEAPQTPEQAPSPPLDQVEAEAAPPPPPLPTSATRPLGVMRAELDQLSAALDALHAQGASQAEIDLVASRLEATRAEVTAAEKAALESDSNGVPADAAPVSIASSTDATPTTPSSHLILGVDLLDVGFINTQQASPTPELELGYGGGGFRFSFLFGLMLGDQIGYSSKLRSTILGTPSDPVGWNWTVDVGLVDLTGPLGSLYLDVSTSPINITWRVASRLVLEARVIGVGYYWSVDGNGLSTWTLEGGLGARWELF